MKKRYISFFVFLLFIFSSCSNKSKQSSDKPLVYTSFYPVYEMTKMIGDDTIDVESFMPLDKQPHLWEPSPKDMKKLVGIEFIKQDETPGLGGRITEDEYKNQYRDLDISKPVEGKIVINKPANGGNIDAISGATQTSTFVVNMINEDVNEFIKNGGK